MKKTHIDKIEMSLRCLQVGKDIGVFFRVLEGDEYKRKILVIATHGFGGIK